MEFGGINLPKPYIDGKGVLKDEKINLMELPGSIPESFAATQNTTRDLMPSIPQNGSLAENRYAVLKKNYERFSVKVKHHVKEQWEPLTSTKYIKNLDL